MEVQDQTQAQDQASTHPTSPTTLCGQCGQSLSIGEYPFCPHGFTRESDALRIAPVLVFQNPETGAFWFPGTNNDPTDVPTRESGFSRRMELTSIREIESLERSMNARLSDEKTTNLQYQRAALDMKTRELREENDAKLRAAGIPHSKIRDLTRRFIDARIEQRRRQAQGLPINFHHQALAFDSSNRQGHADERTGWRDRKG